MHISITAHRLIQVIKRDIGFCTECGREHSDIKPDDGRRMCFHCGAMRVYGAETLLMHPLFVGTKKAGGWAQVNQQQMVASSDEQEQTK